MGFDSLSEVCKYFAFLLQSLSEGRKTKVVEEGQRHEDEFFMAKWVNQRMDIEYDGQGNVFLGVLCFRAEFLSELCFLSKGRKTIEMYMANFCAAHVRTDVNTKGKKSNLWTACQKLYLQIYGRCSVGWTLKFIDMCLLRGARR